MTFTPLAALLALMAPAASIPPQGNAHATSQDVVVPLWVASSVSDALRRFSSVTRRVDCYEVALHREGERLLIQFFPPNDTIVTETAVMLHASKCGAGAVYTYGRKGFVKVTYIR